MDLEAMEVVERATGFEPATTWLEARCTTSCASPAQADRFVRRANVRSRWQFAQTISHLLASASILSVSPLIIRVTPRTLVDGSR